jgi:hypothetical protein
MVRHMTKRLVSSTATLAVAGALVAGCGSSSSTPASTSPSSTPASTSTAAGNSGAASAAEAACQSSINALSTLSPTLKSKLQGVCQKVASGNVGSANAVAKQACNAVVSSLPASEQPIVQSLCAKL